MRSGSVPAKNVLFVVTRKPRARAARMAFTAMSKVPLRQTAWSCSYFGPSMWTEKERNLLGLNFGSDSSSFKAFVQR